MPFRSGIQGKLYSVSDNCLILEEMNEETRMACDCCPLWMDFLWLASYFVGLLFFGYFLMLSNELSKKLSDWLQVGKRYTDLKENNDLLRKQIDSLSSDKRRLTCTVEQLGNEIKRLGES